MPTVTIFSLEKTHWHPWPHPWPTDACGVFRYGLRAEDQPRLLALLLPDEQHHSYRYRQPADRHRFVAGRAWLRWLAGAMAGLPPAQIRVEAGPFGKPHLPNAQDAHGPWFANVSHAGEWVLVALARAAVGVDLEQIDPTFDYTSLLPAIFGDTEQAQIRHSPDPRTEFYTRWTRKESLLKATGQGLSEGLGRMLAGQGTHPLAPGLLVAPGTWSVRSFAVETNYVAAVAQPGHEPPMPCFFTLTNSLLPTPTTTLP